MNLKKIIGLVFFSVLFFKLSAQVPVTVGQWRTHFNYTEGEKIAILNKTIFLATNNSLFYYNMEENSLHRLSGLEGLNDIGVQTIETSKQTNTLIIVYLNSNIDLYCNEEVINMPDIAKKQISGDKTIYNVYCDSNLAYLSCGFGIVIIDLKKRLIKDTWFFQNEGKTITVNDITVYHDTIYAATSNGIYYNVLNSLSIAQFATWKQVQTSSLKNKNIHLIETFNNDIFAAEETYNYQIDTIYNSDSTSFYLDSTILQTIDLVYSLKNGDWKIDSLFGFEEIRNIRNTNNRLVVTRGWGAHAYGNQSGKMELTNAFSSYYPSDAISNQWGYLYIADKQKGLVCQQSDGSVNYYLPGPASDHCWAIDIAQSVVACVPGGYNDWTPLWEQTNVSIFKEEEWNNLLYYEEAFYQHEAYDALDILINPNNTNEMFVASYISGLVHIKDGKVVEIYDNTNSPIQKYVDRIPVNSLAFDDQYNLWMINSQSSNPLIVRTKDDEWQAFNIYYASSDITGKLMIDSRGWIWMTANKEKSLLIFDPNGTPLNTADDKLVKLNISLTEEEGAFDYIYSLAEDKDGNIWIGTNKGIKVYYNPSSLMSEPNTLPSPIKIKEDLEDTILTQLLLGNEIIKCIKVDGGNRKWIGTDNAGVFLESADGETELLHFTVDNSPLISNSINDIDIDGNTGEVFIATDKGLVSFRYTATDGRETYDSIKIFPNPVREDFTGFISITGLKENSEVKITDAFGGLVYRIKSNGGTASWNGCRFDGSRAATGVYFVFVSDENGQEKKAGKILFIK